MSTNIKNPHGLTWRHVIVIVVCLWLILAFIGGEAMKVGSFEISGIGCALRGKEFSRSVNGLTSASQQNSDNTKTKPREK